MMLGEQQQQALAQALRNQPQIPQYGTAPSAQYIMENADALAKGYQDVKNAGRSDAQQYADEFGQYDPQFAAMQAKTPDQGNFMNGLQNKWNGLFGGSGG